MTLTTHQTAVSLSADRSRRGMGSELGVPRNLVPTAEAPEVLWFGGARVLQTRPSTDSPSLGPRLRTTRVARAIGLPRAPRDSVVLGALKSEPNTTTTTKDFGRTLPRVRYTFLRIVLSF